MCTPRSWGVWEEHVHQTDADHPRQRLLQGRAGRLPSADTQQRGVGDAVAAGGDGAAKHSTIEGHEGADGQTNVQTCMIRTHNLAN